MPAFNLIIFDCDGVLVDSEPLSFRALADSLNGVGIPVTAQEIFPYAGHSEKDCLALMEKKFGLSLPEDFRVRNDRHRHQLFDRELKGIAGIEALLDRLTLPRCIASGSSPERLEHCLKLTGLWNRFAPHIFSTKMVARGKPHPDIFLFAADQMKAEPTRCLVIEDSTAGVTAGKAAGMAVWGFTGGGHCLPGHDKKLIEAGADQVFTTIKDIAAALFRDTDIHAA